MHVNMEHRCRILFVSERTMSPTGLSVLQFLFCLQCGWCGEKDIQSWIQYQGRFNIIWCL